MMHNLPGLYDGLNAHLQEINKQIEAVIEEVTNQRQSNVFGNRVDDPREVNVYRVQTRDGKFVLTDLFAAKAQLLSGMATLKAADMASKRKPGGGW